MTSKGNTWMADPSSLRAAALSGRRTPAMIRFPGRPTSCRANCTVQKKIRYSHGDPSVSFDCLELPVARTSSPMPRLAPVTTMVLPVSTKGGMAHDILRRSGKCSYCLDTTNRMKRPFMSLPHCLGAHMGAFHAGGMAWIAREGRG